jgi:hypothetical protein
MKPTQEDRREALECWKDGSWVEIRSTTPYSTTPKRKTSKRGRTFDNPNGASPEDL